MEKVQNVKKKRRFHVPPAFALLMIMIFIAVVATWILPAGQFERQLNSSGKNLVVPGTYQQVTSNPVGIWKGFTSIPRGLVGSASIIFTVLLIGGSFTIIESTGIIQALLARVLKVFKGKEFLMIFILMALLSLMCCFIGLLELSMVVIPILIPICLALGFDSMTAVAMALVSTAAGFGAAIANPFTVVVAQGIGELELYSGSGFRALACGIITLIGIMYVSRYAKRVKANPSSSIMYQRDIVLREEYGMDNVVELNSRRKISVGVFILGFLILIVGCLKFKWNLTEIGTIFIVMALAIGYITGLDTEKISERFTKGLQTFAAAALISGFARAVTLVLEDGQIIDTIINGIAYFVQSMPASIAAVGMLIVQLFFNFLVPSGSGQALISMPIMYPISDIVGVTRQTATLAFQFGDGLSNILWPTLGYMWVCIGFAKIKYEEWFKFVLPLIGIWYCACAVMLMIAQLIGWA